MAKNTPRTTSDLVLHLQRLQEGDDKHKAAKAGHHTATQMAREAISEARKSASACRKSVYAMYADNDKTVEDYGLTTRAERKPRAKKGAPKGDKAPEA